MAPRILFLMGMLLVSIQIGQCKSQPKSSQNQHLDLMFGTQRQRNVDTIVQRGGSNSNQHRLSPEIPPIYKPGLPRGTNDHSLLDIVPVKERQSTRKGAEEFWGTWSEWSLCSRSCGGGVAMRSRRCELGSTSKEKSCSGAKIAYMLCNIKACPGNGRSFRELQCAEHNNKLFRFRKFKWIPYTSKDDGIETCELSCVATQYHFYQSFGIALDGTRCGRDQRNMCIAGECVEIGCDMIVGSTMREDACGVCGGNNGTCLHIENVFIQLKENAAGGFNYNEVARIPKGASHIIVNDYNENFLALMEADDHFERYIINGNWVVSWPGDFQAAGTTVQYGRIGENETFTITGPTTKDLYIMILYLQHQPDIKYEYWIPNSLLSDLDNYYDANFYHDNADYEFDVDENIPASLPDVTTTLATTTSTRTSTATSTTTTTTTATTTTPTTTTLLPTTTKTTLAPRKLMGGKIRPKTSIQISVVSDKPAYCSPCKKPRNRKRHYCNSDFAIHARIISKRRFNHGKSIRFDIEIITTYKSQFKLMKREYIWVPSTCCPKLRPLRNYLLMGRKIKVDITNEGRKKRKSKEREPEVGRRFETRLIVSYTDYWARWKKSYEGSMKKISNKMNCGKYLARH
uniref:ADAMTS-like protein 5 isoform X2 n=1 Tax=Styela clava TaxID=7725 RepID=UPI0019394B89|nr:ADAMTS-like protein 5 isoform X2 [Styela clava]